MNDPSDDGSSNDLDDEDWSYVATYLSYDVTKFSYYGTNSSYHIFNNDSSRYFLDDSDDEDTSYNSYNDDSSSEFNVSSLSN